MLIRPAFSALWNLDLAFADVVSTSSDARLGQIRLAWWRERLEDLDQGKGVPAEPRLQAVATNLIPRGITGAELTQLEDAWLPLLEPFAWTDRQAQGLRLRGDLLFGIGARLLGDDPSSIARSGEIWSLLDGAGHCSDEGSRKFLIEEARATNLPSKAPLRLRALTVLAAVAISDMANASSSLRRGTVAFHHRLTGRFPRLP